MALLARYVERRLTGRSSHIQGGSAKTAPGRTPAFHERSGKLSPEGGFAFAPPTRYGGATERSKEWEGSCRTNVRASASSGSSTVDVVTYIERMPVWGDTIAAPRFEMSFGGKGANQAARSAVHQSDGPLSVATSVVFTA